MLEDLLAFLVPLLGVQLLFGQMLLSRFMKANVEVYPTTIKLG